MELLKQQIPLLYWIIQTLWEILKTASTSLLIFLCFALLVYLYAEAKTA